MPDKVPETKADLRAIAAKAQFPADEHIVQHEKLIADCKRDLFGARSERFCTPMRDFYWRLPKLNQRTRTYKQ